MAQDILMIKTEKVSDNEMLNSLSERISQLESLLIGEITIPALPNASPPSPQASDLAVISPVGLAFPTYKYSLQQLADYQNQYDFNLTAQITLASGKNYGFSGTVAGFYLPSMTQVQFGAIATPPNGLMAWASDLNRIIINAGTALIPSYQDVAYVGDLDYQKQYNLNLTAQITLAPGKNFGFAGTTAGFYLPSMTQAQFDAILSPPNGLMAWADDTNRIRVNTGTTLAPVPEDVAYLSDIAAITTNSVWAEMYFVNNGLHTVFGSVGVPVKVVSSYSPGLLQGFTEAAGTLTYTLPDAITLTLGVSFSAEAVTNPVNLTFFIYVAGSAIAKIQQTLDLDGIVPSLLPIPLSGLVNLVSGNTIEIWVQNNTDTTDIIVGDLNLAVTSIGGSTSPADNVVIAWDGSTNQVSVLGSAYVDITDGTITYTGNPLPTLQDVYDNSLPTPDIAVSAGNPFVLNSVVEGSRTASMTNAEMLAIVNPLNGLEVWLNDLFRKALNIGSPGIPNWQQVAYVSDIPISSSGVYVPTYTASIGVSPGSITNVATYFTTINMLPGNTCIINGYIQYLPTAAVCRVVVTIPFGGVAVNTFDSSLMGAIGADASTQSFFSNFRNAFSLTGTNQITLNIVVPPAAVGVTNSMQYSVSYLIR